jgi:hypothetical protein
VLLATSKNPDLVTNLVNSNFLNRATENTKATEVAANQVLRLAGPTGLEPATFGVTGRRSNQRMIAIAGKATARLSSCDPG